MFAKLETEEECKKLFRKLARLLHPDQGGSHELMILLNSSYEEKIKDFNTRDEPSKPFEKAKSPKIMDGDPRLEIFNQMWDFLEENGHERFNVEFFISINSFINERKYITEKQYSGLVKWFQIWEKILKDK